MKPNTFPMHNIQQIIIHQKIPQILKPRNSSFQKTQNGAKPIRENNLKIQELQENESNEKLFPTDSANML